MAPRPLALWCAPRTGSTAFERMMIERDDHVVLNEPFSAFYYLGPDRISDRFDESMPEATFDRVVADVDEAATGARVFAKDMAYHLGPHLTAATLGRFRNTFMIRDPARAIPSLARKWPDFTDAEAGWVSLERAFDLATEIEGTPPPVIDYDDLLADPPALIRAYCTAVDIPYDEAALSWEPGLPPQWELWREWYENAAKSRGFAAANSAPAPRPSDPRQAAAVAAARPVYERLAGSRLTPPSTDP